MTNKAICLKYREQYGWDMPTLKLARILYKNENLSFASLEAARSSLRGLEGKGDKKSKVLKVIENRPLNPYSLPASDETNYTPFILDAKKLLVLSDIHIPYHSIEALSCAIEWGKKVKPDAILLNGDCLDFFGLSRYAKDPKKKKFLK